MMYRTLAAATALAAVLVSGTAFAEGTAGARTDTDAATRIEQMQLESQGGRQGTASTDGAVAGLSGATLSEAEVRAVQQALKDAGHDITVDGQWGGSTAQAVLEYQQENDLEASGELTPRTIASLGVDLESTRRNDMTPQQAETPEGGMDKATPDSEDGMTTD